MKCVVCKGRFNEPEYNHITYGVDEQGNWKYICKSCMFIKSLWIEAKAREEIYKNHTKKNRNFDLDFYFKLKQMKKNDE